MCAYNIHFNLADKEIDKSQLVASLNIIVLWDLFMTFNLLVSKEMFPAKP